MGGARPTESDLDESSDDDLYASSDEDDEDEEEEEMDGAPSRHRLEWDNDLWDAAGQRQRQGEHT